MIIYGKQTIDQEDIESVINILKSDFLTTGPKVYEFEKNFANYVGSKYAVAVSNGTAALHLTCLSLGISEGDEVICTPMTFAASVNCVLYCGATPVFVDVDENGLMDASLIEEKITSKTKAIIPVHYSGLSCNTKLIKGIADKHNLKIIEDGCHALGTEIFEYKIGSCINSDLCIFSFHPVKHITTGEGGMITTNDEELYNKLLKLRTHGITKNAGEFICESQGPWYYEMQDLGYNYRITDIQCALGVSQLKKIDNFLDKRRSIAKKYDNAFKNNKNIDLLKSDNNCLNSYHLYVIKLKDEKTRLQLFNHLKDNQIYCQVHYIPVHLHPYYQKLGFKKGELPNAEDFYNRVISLPMYPNLTDEEVDYVIDKVQNFFKK
ncbi:UDP-4-amino-4,6-dideoxy-N-acetyl-beta-L-altrosamine transaminase [Methanococcus voltae]|uniref:UDP-4-amino-4, 6-dideoxy-N-acetyl-beta-L-altrosamine transaminase n=1 Tax=Methanococcus voltae TaxID=2188 RepID=A0A8J7RIB4_METVO|nr:UDP-4-amino-4,6-dideoxy-N-acetyl-beta-L-altrosamine transaminase [Methanococcus voltae]MBP2201431.1 UDP-4-amino-4,6-dideoxy-N-acetyl-beta-L-altrosamine transaminase [Methanococcus voltae]